MAFLDDLTPTGNALIRSISSWTRFVTLMRSRWSRSRIGGRPPNPFASRPCANSDTLDLKALAKCELEAAAVRQSNRSHGETKPLPSPCALCCSSFTHSLRICTQRLAFTLSICLAVSSRGETDTILIANGMRTRQAPARGCWTCQSLAARSGGACCWGLHDSACCEDTLTQLVEERSLARPTANDQGPFFYYSMRV